MDSYVVNRELTLLYAFLAVLLLSFLPCSERRFIAGFSQRYGAHRQLQALLLDSMKLAILTPFTFSSLSLLTVALSIVLEMLFLLARCPFDYSDSFFLFMAMITLLELLLVFLALFSGSNILRLVAGRSLIWSWISMLLWGLFTLVVAYSTGSVCMSSILYSNGSWAFAPSFALFLFSGLFMQMSCSFLFQFIAQRMPLDVEGESELISGVSLEFGGILFALFGAVEYGLSLVALCLMVQWCNGIVGLGFVICWMSMCLIRVKAGRVKVVSMIGMMMYWVYIPMSIVLVSFLLLWHVVSSATQ